MHGRSHVVVGLGRQFRSIRLIPLDCQDFLCRALATSELGWYSDREIEYNTERMSAIFEQPRSASDFVPPHSFSSSNAVSRFAVLAFFVLLIAGCAPLGDFFLPPPGIPGEWAAFVDDVRSFERRIGFEPTDNFLEITDEHQAFAFCGYASRLTLPYSYEDPAIRWRDSVTEQDCRTLADGADFLFGKVEALGEMGTPVTAAMITSKLDRFLYLVIHEDCHDQFELPYGVEEALCNLITYKAMAAFSDHKFGAQGREDRTIRRYASVESERTRATIVHYEQLATLYARYERKEVTQDALMRERAMIFSRAKRALSWKNGPLNNVRLANDMTYSRHYPFLESIFDAFERDLARTVAFFKLVDRIKPPRAAVMKQHGIATEDSAEFLRAYETAVVETIRRALAVEVPPRP